MRIAVYHNLPSGGAKRTLFEEVRRLSIDHHIDVYTLSCANHQFADLRPHVDQHKIYEFFPGPLLSSPFGRFNQAIRLSDIYRLQKSTKKIASEIEGGLYDISLIHPCQFESSPSILKYLQNTPTVYYCHEPLRRLYEEMPKRPYEDNKSSLQKSLDHIDPLISAYESFLKKTDRNNLRSATQVLVNSKFIQQAVKDIYCADSVISYHGIDSEWFTPTQEKKKDFVLSVGSLTPLKGFDFLIEAISLIPEKNRPNLVIASNFQNPPEKDYLENLATTKRVGLILEWNVSEERLLQLYNQAKVTVYAAIREPFGLVPVESMACGTAVVAVRDGGVQETIIDGHTGFLVDRDPVSFSQSVQKVLSNPELAQDLGRNGIEHVRKNWTWSEAIKTLEQQLISVLRNNQVH